MAAGCRDPATIAYTMVRIRNSWLTAGADDGFNAPVERGRVTDVVHGITRQLGGHDDQANWQGRNNGQAKKGRCFRAKCRPQAVAVTIDAMTPV